MFKSLELATPGLTTILVIASVFITSVLSVSFDLFEKFHDFSRAHENWELDEALVVSANLVLGLLAILWLHQRRLKQALIAAESNTKAKGEFLSIISHELRTPLTAIKGSLGLLQGKVEADLTCTQMKLVSIASNRSDEMARLVEDLLDFQQIAAGQLLLDKQRTDVADVARRSAASFRSLAEARNIAVHYTGTCEPVFLHLDSRRIQQVIDNFMSNAIKFSTDETNIIVCVSEMAEFVRISVKDNGCGIRNRDHELVFRDFSQADASDTRKHGGVGLGLSISKHIVELHHGKIGFTSRFGEGSEFYFDLPRSLAKDPSRCGIT